MGCLRGGSGRSLDRAGAEGRTIHPHPVRHHRHLVGQRHRCALVAMAMRRQPRQLLNAVPHHVMTESAAWSRRPARRVNAPGVTPRARGREPASRRGCPPRPARRRDR